MIREKVPQKWIWDYIILSFLFGRLLYRWTVTRYFYYMTAPIIILLVVAKYRKYILNDFFSLTILVSQFMVFFSTCKNGLTRNNIFELGSIIALIAFFNYKIKFDDSFLWVLKNFFVYISGMDMCLTFFDKINPNSTHLGLLEHKSYHGIVYMLAFSLMCYYDIYLFKRIRKNTWLFAAISFVFILFILESATSLIAFIILGISICLFAKKRVKFFNLYFALFMDLLFFYFVVYRGSVGTILEYLLNKMGRNSGFTGRDRMWQSGIQMLGDMPILGYGANVTVEYFNGWNQVLRNHCHNFILHILLSGGWIYAILMLVCFVYLAHVLYKNGDLLFVRIMTIIIILELVIGQAEILLNMNYVFMPLLVLAVHAHEKRT